MKRKRSAWDVAKKHQKRRRTGGGTLPPTRRGFSSVARTRGAQVQGEMKYFDTLLNAVAIPASTDWTATELDPTTYLTLFAPIVGAGVDQRIGKSVKVLKIRIRGTIDVPPQVNQVAGDYASNVRIILHQDMQTNSAQAQGEQVMTPPATAAALLAVNSFQNINNFGRFRVLKDKMFTLQNPATSWDGTNLEQQGISRCFKFNVKFKFPVVVRFNATNGGTIADIVDNSFHLLATVGANANLVPVLTYYSRVYYKE